MQTIPCPLPVPRAPRIDPRPVSDRYIRLQTQSEACPYFCIMRPAPGQTNRKNNRG